ncbi:hypothetical protein ACSFA3_12220 [Variovorax sp. RHLX14]|uniref:hypothetical protein n=1 Tax=Variovorax sp. RHLX14 TaxID=1259731 RepID=UPI003F45F0E9
MVGETGSLSMNSGSTGGLAASPQTHLQSPGPVVSFTRGRDAGPAPGWARQPAATTLEMERPAQVGRTGNVGDVTLTMNSYAPMQALLHDYFSSYVNSANRDAFEALVDNRVAGLEEMGHDEERVRQNMSKANRFDWATAATRGAVNAAPFAIASVVIDTVPALLAMANGSAAGQGAIAGAFAGGVDVAGGRLLAPSLSNTGWTNAAPDRMEPVMRQALEERRPGLTTQAANGALVLQSYSARNVARTFAAPVAQSLGGTVARTTVDTVLAAGGGVVAGAASGMASRYLDKRNGMDGPALLFGHKDWSDLYTQLDAATWAGQAGNGLARASTFPGDVLTGAFGAIRSLATPSGVAEQVLLGSGFSGINVATQAVVQSAAAAGLNPPAAQFLGHVANTVLSAPLYAALPPLALGANHLAGVATNAIQSSGWSNTSAPSTAGVAAEVAAQSPHSMPDPGNHEASALIPGNGLRARAVQTTEV